MSTLRALIPALLGAMALFAGVNLLAGALLPAARLDLTQDRLYRLSPAALEVAGRLEEPVSLTFHYSRAEAAAYPVLRAHGARVRDMLRALAARSDGMIRLEEIDPEPFSPEEDAAIEAGLDPAPTEDGGQIFFGLSGRNAIDEARTVAFFDPDDAARAEYEIVRVISQLARDRAPRLAVISSLPFAPAADGSSPNPIVDALADAYELDWIESDFDALPEADALALLHPGELNETQLYLIDQFALETGRVFAAIDPLAHLALKPGPDGLPPVNARRTSDLPGLIEAWGAVYDSTVAVMDRETGLPVQINDGGRSRTRAYPLWFALEPEGLSDDDPATATLGRGVNTGSPGLVSPAPGAANRFTTLAETTGEGARIDSDIAAASPAPDTLLRDYQPAPDAPLTVAARLSGPIRSAFPDGPPAGEAALDPSAHRAGAQSAEIVLIADADWLDPAFYRGGGGAAGADGAMVADNAVFALNLIDALTGDPALAGLRSRAPAERPMVRVQALRERAESRHLDLQEELRARLVDAETRLADLDAAGGSALSGADAATAARAEALRGEIVAARARLRDLERELRMETDALERALIIRTVWLPPLIVVLAGLGLAGLRRRRRA